MAPCADRVREIRTIADAPRRTRAPGAAAGTRPGRRAAACTRAWRPNWPTRRTTRCRTLVASAAGPPLIVVLDGIEDPHNVGAILRTVDAAGAHGVVRQTRHAARLDGAAAKASAGAVAHVKVATVVNIARAIGELKDAGVWTVGLDGRAAETYDHVDFTQPSALVLGAEGEGLRRLVRESCDRLASIPMRGHVASLNVSVAAAVVLFEAVRQRRPRAL